MHPLFAPSLCTYMFHTRPAALSISHLALELSRFSKAKYAITRHIDDPHRRRLPRNIRHNYLILLCLPFRGLLITIMYVELHAVEKHGGRQELWVPQTRALGMVDYCFVGFGCG